MTHSDQDSQLKSPWLTSSGRSDIGRKRPGNQDQFLIADLQRELTVRESSIPDADQRRLFPLQSGSILAVADGIGGSFGGEQASSLAIETVRRYVLRMMNWFLKLSDKCEDDFINELKVCLNKAEDRLAAEIQRSPELSKMGTTLTMAYLIWPKMYVVHAGDSRCYLFRDGRLSQLTTDHTIAQQLLDRGVINQDELATSRFRHVLWNSISAGESHVSAEVSRVNLQDDDIVMLCTDGLTGPVGADEIVAILGSDDAPDRKTQKLIDAANSAGGPDNVTVIVGHCGRLEESADADDENELQQLSQAFTDTLPMSG